MAVFYIKTKEGELYELTSTTDITISENGSITKHKLESGATVADHVVNDNISISFSGIISEIRGLRGASSLDGVDKDSRGPRTTGVQDYISSIRALKESKAPFTVHYDNRFPAADNCLITNLNLQRNKDTGTGYQVVLSFEQIRIAPLSNISIVRSRQSQADLTQGETSSGGNTTEKVENKEPSPTILKQFGETGIDILGQGIFSANSAEETE